MSICWWRALRDVAPAYNLAAGNSSAASLEIPCALHRRQHEMWWYALEAAVLEPGPLSRLGVQCAHSIFVGFGRGIVLVSVSKARFQGERFRGPLAHGNRRESAQAADPSTRGQHRSPFRLCSARAPLMYWCDSPGPASYHRGLPTQQSEERVFRKSVISETGHEIYKCTIPACCTRARATFWRSSENVLRPTRAQCLRSCQLQTMQSANRSAHERPTRDVNVSVTALSGNSSAANCELVPATDRGGDRQMHNSAFSANLTRFWKRLIRTVPIDWRFA